MADAAAGRIRVPGRQSAVGRHAAARRACLGPHRATLASAATACRERRATPSSPPLHPSPSWSLACVAPRRVRNEGWARLSRPMRYIGLCVKLMPQVLCFFHVLTGVVVFASLSFIQAGVCRNAQNSAGDFTFFQSGANLVYFAVVLWSVASCGGFYRKTCLPDAGLASPQSASDVDPPESKLSFEACWQALCCVWTTFRP